MKKSLVALAVAASVVPAMAMADVTIYGRAHVSVDYFDSGAGLDTKDMMMVASNASRFGLKGSEDIMHGLKAMWQVESTVALDEATGTLADRNSFVGVGGGFGTLRIGNYDTPMKMISRNIDPFNDQAGDSRNILGAAGKFDERSKNSISYSSPSMGGATIDALYATGAVGKTLLSAAVNYRMEKMLYVGLGYEMHGGSYNTGGTEGEAAYRVGLSYSVAGATIAGLYQGSSNVGGVKDSERAVMGGSVAYKLGDDTVKVQYYMANEKKVGSTTTADSNGAVLAFGFDHAMSKATTVYVAYAMSMNGDAATFSAAGAGGHNYGVTTTAKKDAMNLSFGVAHNF